MIEIKLPEPFNLIEVFRYLKRGQDEISFCPVENGIIKLFHFEKKLILAQITFENEQIKIDFPCEKPSIHQQQFIRKYIIDWFDLTTDLPEIYRGFERMEILQKLGQTYFGLRLIKMPDIYEAICWSIIGQQINLTFAYQCKRRLVETAGASYIYKKITYYAFPKPQQILSISDEEFKAMKFSSQKVRYIRIVSKLMIENKISKEKLMQMDYLKAKASLMAIKGIGEWSANYVLMRCLGFKEALPLADAGLHNALKNQLKLNSKPTKEELSSITKNWEGYASYATFYLWQSLLN